MDLVIRGRRVVLPDGERPASVWIADGRFVRVGAHDDTLPEGVEAVDAGSLIVSPGLVDTHVHVNEPGRTAWEGFTTATRAAAAGGVTTIIDMPLNSTPATISVEALEAKRMAARRQCFVDVGFWGGIVPGAAASIAPLADAGVRGFKCFLAPSGVDDFAPVGESDLHHALGLLREAARSLTRRLPLLVHAEDPRHFRPFSGATRSYAAYLATRPVEAEVAAIRTVAELARLHDVPAHIVHISSAEGIAAVEASQSAGAPITGETCPHYLSFSAADVPDGGTVFKCAPPIREERHRRALWDAVGTAGCGLVASDHSPAPPDLKAVETGDFAAAWGGIASVELSLPAVWTGARERGGSPSDLARWMSEGPAGLAGLQGRKGTIAPGADADLVLWDPDVEVIVDASRLQQRHKLTPYDGCRLRGLVRATYLRGTLVFSAGDGVDSAAGPHGRLL
jgi:allantoinase